MKSIMRLGLVVAGALWGNGYGELHAEKSFAHAQQKARPLIEWLTCSKNTIKIGINDRFKRAYLKSDFFATYDEDINLAEMPYELITMPLLCNIIALIWISGETYSIESMDENLYYSFKKVKEIFRLSYPTTAWNGELVPDKVVSFSKKYPNDKHTRGQRALLFSGGLDSTSSLFLHNDEKLLLITAWGQYDNPLKERDAWELRKRQVRKVAALYGHTNSFIKSNYAEFFNWPVVDSLSPELPSWRIYAVDGIGWSGLVAPILFAKKRSALYIASSNSWYHTYIDCINPFVDGSMHFAHYRLLHDQFECTRLDKAAFIVRSCKEKGFKKPYIKVCQRTGRWGDSNCCDCKKCLLTILELCAAGALHQEYGFNVSLKTAVKRISKLLQMPIDYETMWHCMDIQLTMKRALEQYDSATRALLDPFLEINLMKTNIVDRKFASRCKVDWNDFTKLVPSVVMPPDLLDEKWEVERRASAALRRRTSA